MRPCRVYIMLTEGFGLFRHFQIRGHQDFLLFWPSNILPPNEDAYKWKQARIPPSRRTQYNSAASPFFLTRVINRFIFACTWVHKFNQWKPWLYLPAAANLEHVACVQEAPKNSEFWSGAERSPVAGVLPTSIGDTLAHHSPRLSISVTCAPNATLQH